ncbi:hypothetical protein QMK17_12870 [Rhodococcus sp. G-MC3]|uniref:hypothetical protein n=1 Tax=Rhodococcus sp. G-MC3 TaxID=3046209 RepID=UPI0024BADA41|nr:hypothetical protein [Rhodococcus sp. G-MC3]MDJ0394222.1 hypothetical protein [Rhodococcus sp. G-MC3]
MSDCSDQAQAGVFTTMLRAEITAVSSRVEESERLSQTAWETGHASTRLWHREEALLQRALLYELHRQLDALNRRFPSTAVVSQPS